MGEIVTVNQANQFKPGYTVFACGFFAVAMLTSSAPVGRAPIKSPGQIQDDAFGWYAQYNGSAGPDNWNGMSLAQLYQLLDQVQWEHHPVALQAEAIRAELRRGNPVIAAITEASVVDLDLGRNPYPWNPVYNHVILLTGLAGNDVLCRDSANIAPPNTLRPGPRRYQADRLQFISATACVPHFPPVGDPRAPVGWHDDGTTLTAPNGHRVVLGFRDYVLSHGWDAHNLPLEEERHMRQLELSNPKLGSGSQQIFLQCVLEWCPQYGVIKQQSGQELMAIRKAYPDYVKKLEK